MNHKSTLRPSWAPLPYLISPYSISPTRFPAMFTELWSSFMTFSGCSDQTLLASLCRREPAAPRFASPRRTGPRRTRASPPLPPLGGLFGMDFRVSLVVIATLVVTERPLAAGNRDLVRAPRAEHALSRTVGTGSSGGFQGLYFERTSLLFVRRL